MSVILIVAEKKPFRKLSCSGGEKKRKIDRLRFLLGQTKRPYKLDCTLSPDMVVNGPLCLINRHGQVTGHISYTHFSHRKKLSQNNYIVSQNIEEKTSQKNNSVAQNNEKHYQNNNVGSHSIVLLSQKIRYFLKSVLQNNKLPKIHWHIVANEMPTQYLEIQSHDYEK